MSQLLTLELSDELYAMLQQQSSAAGLSISEWIIESLSQKQCSQTSAEQISPIQSEEESLQRLLRYAGAVGLGHPTGSDNESIDADLTRAYANEF
jgi:predicted CopG family antitoxin